MQIKNSERQEESEFTIYKPEKVDNNKYIRQSLEPERCPQVGTALCIVGGDNMELLAQYVIPMDTRTKKNHMTIAGTGARCPVCGKRKKQFIRQGHANTKYTFLAAQYLNPKSREPIGEPVQLVYTIYTETRRKVDDLNLYASLDDLLVKEQILKDDNRSIIRSRDGSRVLYDKEHPRAEIYIYKYTEDEDNGIE